MIRNKKIDIINVRRDQTQIEVIKLRRDQNYEVEIGQINTWSVLYRRDQNGINRLYQTQIDMIKFRLRRLNWYKDDQIDVERCDPTHDQVQVNWDDHELETDVYQTCGNQTERWSEWFN